MNPGPTPERWWFVERDSAELVLVPQLLGLTGDCSVILREGEQELATVDLPAAGAARLPLPPTSSVGRFSISLRVLGENGWRDVLEESMVAAAEVSVTAITPSEWGVDDDCVAVLRRASDQHVVLQVPVQGGQRARCALGGTPELALSFHRPSADGSSPAGRIGAFHRWVPTSEQPSLPAPVHGRVDGLQASIRREVTLAPAVQPLTSRRGLLSTRGYIGAWEAGSPVVEAMDYALGAQYYRFLPTREPSRHESGTAIYLGPPRNGWGHFLTQGLSRVWYALAHPDVPVIWDGKLKPYMREALDLIGLRNPQLELARPQRWDEVIFPFPGCCIGEFVLPAWTRAVGRVQPRETVPGKKLFLSRSGLTAEGPEHETDQQLDALAQRFGFAVFHPEQHSVADQLAEMSSAEVVLGVEGSALHTPLLLADPVRTRFWALTRHRGGSGVFEHLKQAKKLHYETLTYLRTGRGGHRDPIDLDLDALEADLERTSGLQEGLEVLEPRVERPWPGQTSYSVHLRHTEIDVPERDHAMLEALLALRRKDYRQVTKLVASQL